MTKWIVHSPVFNQEHFIRAWVKNASAYADVVLATFSETPWSYNSNAHKDYLPDNTGRILAQLEREYPKLRVIKGHWGRDSEERTEAAKIAKEMGGDYLLIADVDEFFVLDQIEKAKQYILDHPSDYWVGFQYQIVKKPNWAAISENGLTLGNIAIDLSKVGRFLDSRTPEGTFSIFIPEKISVCYHFSYCMPFTKILQKISTFRHARQIQRNWLKNVWPKIQPGIEDFHPVWPAYWKKLIEIDLPDEIRELYESEQINWSES